MKTEIALGQIDVGGEAVECFLLTLHDPAGSHQLRLRANEAGTAVLVSLLRARAQTVSPRLGTPAAPTQAMISSELRAAIDARVAERRDALDRAAGEAMAFLTELGL